ncbi:GNAT family N-acetyltransferase [Paenibacillus taiwanensis]|uniref:GNAT family N-acetyltransferase n=1 Tax=Paenibacillus taiwanensis TaxID=401638 RepID=UPI0003F8C0A0|nr:GNAT family N-acetyltransferase [Paenibacillus taiwanensis]
MRLIIQALHSEKMLDEWRETFKTHGVERPEGYFERCYDECNQGERVSLLAYVDDKLAGCIHLKLISDYAYFALHDVPEINDLFVFPVYRRLGVATRLISELELEAVNRGKNYVGIGVGLYPDYGPAQRCYARLGYVPDGKGIQYNNHTVTPGATVCVDDDLLIYLAKPLAEHQDHVPYD